MRKFAAFSFIIACLLPLEAAAEQVDVGGVQIEIPGPAGYASIRGQEELFSRWSADTPQSAKFLAGFMSESDYADWQESRDFDYGFYNAIAVVDRAMLSLDATTSLLESLADKSSNMLESSYTDAFVEGVSTDGQRKLNPALEERQLGLVDSYRTPQSFTYLQLEKDPSADNPMSARAVLLVNKRIIELNMDGYYETYDDVDWLKRSMDAWVEAIKSANQ